MKKTLFKSFLFLILCTSLCSCGRPDNQIQVKVVDKYNIINNKIDSYYNANDSIDVELKCDDYIYSLTLNNEFLVPTKIEETDSKIFIFYTIPLTDSDCLIETRKNGRKASNHNNFYTYTNPDSTTYEYTSYDKFIDFELFEHYKIQFYCDDNTFEKALKNDYSLDYDRNVFDVGLFYTNNVDKTLTFNVFPKNLKENQIINLKIRGGSYSFKINIVDFDFEDSPYLNQDKIDVQNLSFNPNEIISELGKSSINDSYKNIDMNEIKFNDWYNSFVWYGLKYINTNIENISENEYNLEFLNYIPFEVYYLKNLNFINNIKKMYMSLEVRFKELKNNSFEQLLDCFEYLNASYKCSSEAAPETMEKFVEFEIFDINKIDGFPSAKTELNLIKYYSDYFYKINYLNNDIFIIIEEDVMTISFIDDHLYYNISLPA